MLYNRVRLTVTNYAQTVDMHEKAFKQIPDGTNLILHSDQGWKYQIYDYQRRLKEKENRQSMSRKGNCLDNSVMENFFGLLKSELLYLQEFGAIEHFKKKLIEYLSWYNEKRIKVKLTICVQLESVLWPNLVPIPAANINACIIKNF